MEKEINKYSTVDPQVQVIIASTNGIHYLDRTNKLTEYPQFELPVKPAIGDHSLMLDIGCGWGRWLVAGAKKNYIPIGLDLIPEFAETSLTVLKAHDKTGYAVVGDLEHIPFKENVFDLVWSFSVIQHMHYDKMISCLSHINRVLKRTGYTFLEFPNRYGLRNAYTSRKWEKYRDDKIEQSLSVRYYSINQYRKFFTDTFGNFAFTNHSFLGIGVLKEDIRYVSWKNKVLCYVSLFGSFLTTVIPPMKYLSDSIYITATTNLPKKPDSFSSEVEFLTLRERTPQDNLIIVPLLQCPKTGFEVQLSEDRSRVLVPKAGIFYPVINSIPHMLIDKAQSM